MPELLRESFAFRIAEQNFTRWDKRYAFFF